MKIEMNPCGNPAGKSDTRIHYDSLGELAEFLTSEAGKDPCSVVGSHARHHHDADGTCVLPSQRDRPKDWDLGSGFDGAVKLAFTGWDEGAEKVRDFGSKVTVAWPHAETSGLADGIDFAMSDEGDEIEIESLLEGDDMHWRAPVFQCEKPIIRIAVNIGALGDTSARSMMGRGIVCAAAIQQIERLGFAVQLYIGHVSAANSTMRHVIRTVMIKDSDEYVDESVIAFWLAHPAAIRRITFRMMDAAPFSPSKVGQGMGQTQEFTSGDLDYIAPSVHAMESSGALNNEDKMIEATVKMVESIMRDRKQVTEQFNG